MRGKDIYVYWEGNRRLLTGAPTHNKERLREFIDKKLAIDMADTSVLWREPGSKLWNALPAPEFGEGLRNLRKMVG